MASPLQLTAAQNASMEYQKAHTTESRGPMMVGVSCLLYVLAVAAVVLRFVAQRSLRRKLRVEDVLMLLALIFGTGLFVIEIMNTHWGAGRHQITVGVQDISMLGKLLIPFQLCYFLLMWTLKTSVLISYNRIFENRIFRLISYCVAVAVGLWGVACVIGTFLQCIPFQKTWNRALPGACIDYPPLFILYSTLNLATDFIIVVMPIPVIWRLQMPREKRITVSVMFGLGGIVIVASAMRLASAGNFNVVDITYDSIWIGLWSVVECCLAIVGGNLPLMAPLYYNLVKYVRDITSTFGTSRLPPGWDKNSAGITISVGPGSEVTMPAPTRDTKKTFFLESKGSDSTFSEVELGPPSAIRRDFEIRVVSTDGYGRRCTLDSNFDRAV